MYLGIENYKEKDYLINVRGDVSICYKVQFPPIFTYTSEEFESIQRFIARAISQLPPYMILQRLDFVYRKQNTYQVKQNDLSEEQEKRFYNSIYHKEIECFFIFTSVADPNVKRGYFSSLLETMSNKDKLLKKNHFSSKEISDFNIAIDNFFTNISSGFKGKLRHKLLNHFEIKTLVESYYFNLEFNEERKTGIRNTIVDKDTHILSGFKEGIVLTMDKFPKNIYSHYKEGKYKPNIKEFGYLPVSMFYELYFKHNEDIIVSTIFYPQDQRKKRQEITEKAKFLSSFAFGDKNNLIAANSVSELDDFLSLNKDDTVIELHQSYIVVNKDYENIEKRARRLEDIKLILEDYDMELSLNTDKSLRVMVSNAPGNGSDVNSDDRIFCTAGIASKLNLIENSSKDHSTVGLTLMDIITKERLLFDIDKYDSKHFAIFGAIGTGKSFTMNHILNNLILNGRQVIIADVGYSYQDQCEYFNGRYVELSEKNPLKMNPFLNFPKDREGNFILDFSDEDTIELLVFTTELFGVCYKGSDKGSLSTSERNFITELIRSYLMLCKERKSFPKFDDFFENIEKIVQLNQELQVSETSFSVKDFKLIMKQFTSEGIYGTIFNTDKNTELDKEQLVIFEFEHIKENKTLFPITYFILSNMVLKRMYDKERIKSGNGFYFILDELHFLLSGDYGNTAPFLEYCIRTFRKWGAGFGLSTQNISDLFANASLKDKLINNISLFYFKQQSNAQIKPIQEGLMMSDANIAKLFSIQDRHREIFIYDKNGEGNLFRIETSPFKYWLYTTNPKDKSIKMKAKEKYGDIRTAISFIIKNLKS